MWGWPAGDDDDDVADDDSASTDDDDTTGDDDDTTPGDDDDSASTDDDDTTADDDDDTVPPPPISASVEYSECLGGGQVNPTVALTDQGGGELQVELDAWELNCCLEMVVAQATYDGSAVLVALQDVGEPCDCICGFDVIVTVEGLPAGEVMVVVQFGGQTVVNEAVEMS